MKHKTIAQQMSQHPYELYKTLETLDKASYNEVCKMEESLTTLLYAEQNQQIHKRQFYDENEIAIVVEEWEKTGRLPNHVKDPALAAEAYRVLSSMNRMEDTRSIHSAVPQVLQDIVEHSLNFRSKASRNKQSVPALVVELTANGLRLLKSTLQGYQFIPQPSAVIRQARSSEEVIDALSVVNDQEDLNHLVLYQKKPKDYLQYEVLRKANNSVALTIYSPQCYRDTRVSLKQNNRIIASQTFNPKSGKVSFKHIATGYYQIEYYGAMDYSIQIVVRDARKAIPNKQ